MASNATTIADQDGDFSDWIELHNRGDQPIPLHGFGLSDNYNNPYKWVFPNITIQPGEYLLVWASGKDRSPQNGELHTNYSIAASGEEIILTTPDGIRLDELEPIYIPTDVSIGRPGPSANTNKAYSTTNNTNATNSTNPLEWHFFDNPTPGAENGSDGYLNILTPPQFSVPPGFYGGEVYLQVFHTDPGVTLWVNSWSDPTAFTNGGGDTLATDQRFISVGSSTATLHLQPDTSNDINQRLAAIRTNPIQTGPAYGRNFGWSKPKELLPRAHTVQVTATKPGALPSTISTGTYFINIPLASPPPAQTSDYEGHPLSASEVLDPYGRPPAGVEVQKKQQHVPVISINIKEEDFFSDSTGIYVPGDVYNENGYGSQHWGQPWANYHQSGTEWERVVSMEVFEGVERVLHQDLGVRIHGGGSRALPMKSLRLYARNAYGESTMAYDFFGDARYNAYKRLLLRNSGQDFFSRGVMFRDGFMQLMVSGLRVETMAYRPSIVYLNGEYWGIHNIRERYDHHYFERKYGIAEGEFDLLDYVGTAEYGNGAAYAEIRDYLVEADMRDSTAYDFASERIDLGNVIDYQASQMFIGNNDWPANNAKFWRYAGVATDAFGPRDGRFRWLLYDTDFGFNGSPTYGVTHNMLKFATDSTATGWPNAAWSSVIMRRLLENDQFREQFIVRSADLLNSVYASEYTLGMLNDMAGVVEPLIGDHVSRWNHVSNTNLWRNNVNLMRTFAAQRPGYVWGHYVDYFNLPNTYAVHIDMQSTGKPSVADEDSLAGPGYIRVNSLELGAFEGAQQGYIPGSFESAFEKPDVSGERLRVDTGFPWEGTYFGGVALNLEAAARDGYLFDIWEINGSNFMLGDSLYTENTFLLLEGDEITIISYDMLNVVAHYITSTGSEPKEPELPRRLSLGSNYPNPFNPTTIIPFALPESGDVRLDVFDVTGRHVGTFLNQQMIAGRHEVSVDLSGVSSGVYIYRLQTQDQVMSGKMMLLK
jgi:hypothetical protein